MLLCWPELYFFSNQVLSENKIGNEGAIALSEILGKNDAVHKLDLSGMMIFIMQTVIQVIDCQNDPAMTFFQRFIFCKATR